VTISWLLRPAWHLLKVFLVLEDMVMSCDSGRAGVPQVSSTQDLNHLAIVAPKKECGAAGPDTCAALPPSRAAFCSSCSGCVSTLRCSHSACHFGTWVYRTTCGYYLQDHNCCTTALLLLPEDHTC
jgi:hypothetical protein